MLRRWGAECMSSQTGSKQRRMEPRKHTGLLHWVTLAAVVTIFASGWSRFPGHDVSPFLLAGDAPTSAGTGNAPLFVGRFVSSSVDDIAHSASLAPLGDGSLIAAWFAGSREGSPSVAIRGSVFDAHAGEWGGERTLIDRAATASGVLRHIRKLGNPVVALTPDKRLWLFYVSVSVGGWALSGVNVMYSDDLGQTWSTPRRLVTSPFFNVSTLVRGVPVFHRDGSIGLPVYHEFIGKFAEYLYLDRNGRVVEKFRISKGSTALQPTVVPFGEYSAVALLRNSTNLSAHVLASRTADGGRSWSAPEAVTPKNQDSSLAAIRTGERRNTILVALNNLGLGRFRLSLYETEASLRRWTRIADLDQSPDPGGALIEPKRYRALIHEKYLGTAGARHRGMANEFLRHLDQRMCQQAGCAFEYEYPNLLRTADGRFHVVYTWNNSFIKHVTFNSAWLESFR